MKEKRSLYTVPCAELIELDLLDVIRTSAGGSYHPENQGPWDKQE